MIKNIESCVISVYEVLRNGNKGNLADKMGLSIYIFLVDRIF